MRISKVDQVIEDERGSITQVVSFGKWKQLNLFSRKQSSLGGGHYHKKTREFFYLIDGQASVKIASIRDGIISSHVFKSGDCFEMQPFEQHYFKFLSDTCFIALYSTIFNKDKPDVYVADTLPSLKDVFR